MEKHLYGVIPALSLALFGSAAGAIEPLSPSEATIVAEDIQSCLIERARAEDDFAACKSIYVENCLNGGAENETTSGMVICTSNAQKAWDVLLNRYYQIAQKSVAEIVPIYDENLVEIFKDAQRNWLSFRDAECLSQYTLYSYGGSISRVLGASCNMDMTASRAIYYFQWQCLETGGSDCVENMLMNLEP